MLLSFLVSRGREKPENLKSNVAGIETMDVIKKMPKKYSTEFKMDAVHLLFNLKEDGEVYIEDSKITNVRDLVEKLGISSCTLYDWTKKFSKGEIEEEEIEDPDLDPEEFEEKEELIPGEKIEPDSNFETLTKLEVINEIILDWEITIKTLEFSIAQMREYKEKLNLGDN